MNARLRGWNWHRREITGVKALPRVSRYRRSGRVKALDLRLELASGNATRAVLEQLPALIIERKRQGLPLTSRAVVWIKQSSCMGTGVRKVRADVDGLLKSYPLQ